MSMGPLLDGSRPKPKWPMSIHDSNASDRLRCRLFLRVEPFELGRLGFHAKARLSVLNQQAADAAGSFIKFQ